MRWFAWYPVRLKDTGKWAWLRRVEWAIKFGPTRETIHHTKNVYTEREGE